MYNEHRLYYDEPKKLYLIEFGGRRVFQNGFFLKRKNKPE